MTTWVCFLATTHPNIHFFPATYGGEKGKMLVFTGRQLTHKHKHAVARHSKSAPGAVGTCRAKSLREDFARLSLPMPPLQKHISAFQSILTKVQKVDFLCCAHRQCTWSLFLKLLLKIYFFIDFKTQVHCNKGLCWRKWKFGQSSHAATMHLRLEPVLMAMIWKLPIFVALSLSTFAQAAGPGEILTDWFRWEKKAKKIFCRIFVSFPK